MKLLTIDPGLSGTGWAQFENNKLYYWGIVWPKKGKDIMTQIHMDILHFYDGEKIVIEWPSFQGMIAQNTGSIIKLAYLIGRIYETCLTFEYKPELLPVSKWRGTCPKEINWKRAEKFFGKKGFKSHAADAVSMGAFLIQENLV